MNAKKILSVVIIALNIIGIICLIYYAIPFLSHDTTVHNPDAMLPAEAWDDAGIALTFGLLPLIIVNTAAFMRFKLKRAVRYLWLLPCIICLLLVVAYFVVSFG